MAPKSILITGANRGIGLGLLKQFIKNKDVQIIIGTCRDPSNATELNSIKDTRVHILQLDIDCDDSIRKLGAEVEKLVGEDGLTVLINNAGIFVPYDIDGEKSRSTLIRQLETNTISTVLITQELLPLLKRAAAKNRGEGYSINRSLVAYRMSKSALNSFGKSCSVDLAKYHILVTTFCPGWVKTDMGGANGKLEIDDATKTLSDNILILGDAHHGAYLNADLTVIPNF